MSLFFHKRKYCCSIFFTHTHAYMHKAVSVIANNSNCYYVANRFTISPNLRVLSYSKLCCSRLPLKGAWLNRLRQFIFSLFHPICYQFSFSSRHLCRRSFPMARVITFSSFSFFFRGSKNMIDNLRCDQLKIERMLFFF